MDTLQVVWARYTGAFLFPFIVSNPWTRPGLMITTRPVLQLFRSLLLLVSTICNFFSLRYLQLDESVAIQFSTPFFVAALSGPLLGEWVRWRRWAGDLRRLRGRPGGDAARALAVCIGRRRSRWWRR